MSIRPILDRVLAGRRLAHEDDHVGDALTQRGDGAYHAWKHRERTDAQGDGRTVTQTTHILARAFQLVEPLRRVCDQVLASSIRYDATACAIKQHCIKTFLDFLQQFADRRLRQGHLPGRCTNAALPPQQMQQFKVAHAQTPQGSPKIETAVHVCEFAVSEGSW